VTPYVPRDGGRHRLDLAWKGVRLTRMTFASERDHRALVVYLHQIKEYAHGLAAWRAVRDGTLTPGALLAAGKAGKLPRPDFMAELALDANLWDTLERLFPMDAPARTQARRYAVSAQKLARLADVAGLDARSTVRDLEHADWAALAREWPDSPDDYMALRVMVGRALSLLLGDPFHPWRRAVMSPRVFPRMRRTERRVSLDAETFWTIVDRCPEHIQPSLVFLLVTGARLGEYLALDRDALDARARTVLLRSGKGGGPGETGAQSEPVYVDPDVWGWIDRAVPAPVRSPTGIRKPFKQALVALGIDRRAYRLHDLRHSFAQLASDAGAPEAQIQAALRHADPNMTRRYALTTARKAIAGVVAGAIRRKA
jgi:integrase